MHILFIGTSILLFLLGLLSFSFSAKRNYNIIFSVFCFSCFFYVLSIYSLTTSFSILLLKSIWCFALLSAICLFSFLLYFTNTRFHIIDKLLILLQSTAIISIVIADNFVKQVYINDNQINLLSSGIKIEYGIIHKFLFPIALLFFLRFIYIGIKSLRNNQNTPGLLLSLGSILLAFFFVFVTNGLFPLIFGHSEYSYLASIWLSIIGIGNFWAIIKYQHLNVMLVINKAISFLIFWGGIFSLSYLYLLTIGHQLSLKFGMSIYYPIILCICLGYPIFRLFIVKISSKIFAQDKLNYTDLLFNTSQAFLNAKTTPDILKCIQHFCYNIESKNYGLKIRFSNGNSIFDGSIMTSTLNQQYEDKSITSKELLTITYEKNNISVFLNFKTDNQSYGWMNIEFPFYKDFSIILNKNLFISFTKICINSIQLIESFNDISYKIDSLSNSNKFISKLPITSIHHLSNSILHQFQKRFKFDHIILPELKNDQLEWSSSTIFAPNFIRNLIFSMDFITKITFPFYPKQYINNDHQPNAIQQVCNYYQCNELIIIPVTQNNSMIGYFIVLNKHKTKNLDMNLLDLISKQISSIINRFIVRKKISDIRLYYQEILDHLPTIIIILNNESEIEFKNKAFNQYFQKDYSELSELVIDYPKLDIIRKILDYSDTEVTIKLNEQHFKLSLRQLMDHNTIILLTDITKLIDIQNNISKTSKLKSLGIFVAGIAHEIKNPLVAVKTFTQLISNDWTNQTLREKCNEIVLPQLNKINELSDSLNHLGNQKSNNFKPIKIADIINNTVNLIKSNQSHNSTIQLSVHGDLNILVFADHIALNQVFLNLLLNAIDAVKENPSPVISFNVFSESLTTTIIEIEDNGTGISKEKQQFLFDPFFTTKDTGTGLGLSIVHQIISNHQGTISIKKSNSSGTVFRISLPKLLRPKIKKKENHVVELS